MSVGRLVAVGLALMGQATVTAGLPRAGTLRPRVGAERRYRLVDLGSLGGGMAQASAINRAGDVVGWSRDRVGDEHAFLWRAGHMRDLDTLGSSQSKAWGLNSRGQVVGEVAVLGPGVHAFLWEHGRMRDISERAGELYLDTALSVNDEGLVVGHAHLPGAYLGPATWQRGRLRLLPMPPEYDVGGAVSVNSRGAVAGNGGLGPSTDLLLWRDGRLAVLPRTRPGEHQRSEAVSGGFVSDRGVVAGSRYGGGRWRAAVWVDGLPQTLPSLGGRDAQAWAINSHGDVVGRIEAPRPSLPSTAVLWSGSQVLQLAGLVHAPGWRLERAVGINDAGWIAGNGQHRGREKAFVLIPRARRSNPPRSLDSRRRPAPGSRRLRAEGG